MEFETGDIQIKEEQKPSPSRAISKFLFAITILTLVSLYIGYRVFLYLDSPTTNFPVGTEVIIPEGASVERATKILSQGGYIKSDFLLYASLILWHEDSSVKAGTYIFDRPLSTREVANEITQGRFVDNLVKFTHIEGERASTLATRASKILPNFDSEEFIVLTKGHEGKLFPDTYLLPKDYTAKELFTLLTETFSEKISPLESKILESELTLEEIIILASIIEREANSVESMKMVSGILQNRLAIDMPLQADASIEYILAKPLKELTTEDLKIDSPYNTYLNLGLPPTAIGNPGLDAITAVLEPTESDYYFYITGNDGKFYYAKNFDAHRVNIAKYLR